MLGAILLGKIVASCLCVERKDIEGAEANFIWGVSLFRGLVDNVEQLRNLVRMLKEIVHSVLIEARGGLVRWLTVFRKFRRCSLEGQGASIYVDVEQQE